jgi:hypothetical protein
VKAFIVDRYQRNGALRLGELPEPEVRDHDVLVAVRANEALDYVVTGRAKGKVVITMGEA